MAYTLQFNSSNVSLLSTWAKNGTVVTRHANTATASRTIDVTGIPNRAIIESAALTVKMRGYAAYGTNKELCTVNGVNCNSSGTTTPAVNTIPLEVTGNQTVNLEFAYKGNEQVGTKPGVNEYSLTATFEDITLSVAYSMPAPTQPPSVSSGWYSLSADNEDTAVQSCPYYVVGYSKVKADFDPNKVTLYGGASIQSFSITFNGTTTTKNYASGHVYITSGVVLSASSNIVLTITDSNGNRYTESANIDAYAYARPTLTSLSAYRSDANKVASDNGTYITAKANLNFTPLNGWNTCTLTTRYKLQGGAYTSPATLENNTLTIINSLPISAQSNYMVRIDAVDRLGNNAVYEQTIKGAEIPFHIKRGGNGAAFGKYSQINNSLDLAWVLIANAGIRFDPDNSIVKISSDLSALPNLPYGLSATNTYGSFIEIGSLAEKNSRYFLIIDYRAEMFVGKRVNNSATIGWHTIATTPIT